MNFLHSFLPQSIAFEFGFLTVHWYGLFLGLGLIAGIISLHFLLFKYQKDPEVKYSVIYSIVIPAILGARLYYVIYAWEFYKNDFFAIFRIWEGGLAIHGVIVGGLLGLFWYTWRHKESFLWWADLLVPCLVIGQAIGRWGNYFNQELYGKPTDLAWGIPINTPTAGYEAFTYFHPTFLYESLLNLNVFIILLVLHYLKMRKTWSNGYILFVYIGLYSVIRFGMEFLRLDYSPVFYGIRWAQFLSFGLFLFSLIGIGTLYFYNKKAIQTQNNSLL